MPQNPFDRLATGATAAPPSKRKKSRNPFDQLQPLPAAPPVASQIPAGPPEGPGFFENVKIGAQRAMLSAADAGRVLNEAVSAAASGDFEPLKQLAETVGRGVAPFVSATANPQTAGASFMLSREAQAEPIAQLTRQREERIAQIPELYSSEAVDAETRARLAARAALDPSFLGKATRGASEFVTGALPAVATGIATGGSVPAVGAVVGLQSLGQPENLIPAVALATTPLPVGKVVAPLLRRLRGGKIPAVEPVIEPAAAPESPTALPGPAGPALPVRRAPANVPGPEAPGPPIARPPSPAPAFPGARPGNLPGPGGPRRMVIPEAENPFSAIESPPATPTVAAEASPALRSAMEKLGTDDVNQIGAIIENSNRRFRLSSTPEERASSMEDFKLVSQLTPAEENALAEVLPARTVSPIEPIPGPSGAGQSRAISDIPMSEANAQLDANLRELEAFFGAQAGRAEPKALAMAVGRDAFDGAKVKTADIGLPSKTAPAEASDAIPVARMVKAEDLTLGRDDLSKGRMFQVQENLNEGLKPGGAEFKTPGGKKGVTTAIRVTPDPAEPGKFIVGGDGNHRTAFLKLQGYTGDIPVVSMESPAQTAAMQLKAVPLNELEVAASRGAKIAETRGPAIQQEQALKSGTLVAPAEKSSILDTLTGMWKAGLLTSPKTHIRNIFGTGGFQLSEQAARVPASIADIVRAAFTGRRTVAGPNLASLFRADAAKKGITGALEILRKGLTAEQAAKMQTVKQLASGNRVIDAYVNGVFRLLGAEDQFIRTMALRSALEERATVQVLNEIRQGITARGDRAARISQLVANPDNALAAQAASDAEIAVFTNDNAISTALGKARQSLAASGTGGKAAKLALDVALPFDKTPTNIIARMLDYSPVGLGRGTVGIARGIAGKAFTPKEERLFAQLFGRGAIGTGLIVLGWKLGEAGLATGMFEDEPGKSARDVAAGRLPGAIRIGDTWRQITGFAPLGNLVALGASLNREFEQSREPEEKQLPEAIGGVFKNFAMEQPLLQAAQSVTQPGSLTERAGRLAASVIPGAVADAGEMFDVRRSAKGEGFLGQIAARTPGVRNYFSPPAVDALGRPLEDRFSRFIDPTLTSTARETREPLIQEMIRLDVGLPKMQRKPGEDADAYLTRVRRFGQLYQDYGLQLLNSGRFQGLNDQVKAKAFDALSRRAQAQVSEEFEERRKHPIKNPNLRLNPNEVIQSALSSK